MNKSAKIVWERINGFKNVQEIIGDLVTEYGKDNDEDSIIEIVEASMQMFLDNSLVVMKTTNEFDGWLQYE